MNVSCINSCYNHTHTHTHNGKSVDLGQGQHLTLNECNNIFDKDQLFVLLTNILISYLAMGTEI